MASFIYEAAKKAMQTTTTYTPSPHMGQPNYHYYVWDESLVKCDLCSSVYVVSEDRRDEQKQAHVKACCTRMTWIRT